MNSKLSFDVAVIGAGVFGAWTAYKLADSGASVALIDAYGPANSRASSGGESRIIRFGYGGDEVYTLSAQQSLAQWKTLFEETRSELVSPLFHQSGVLWLARETDTYCSDVLATLSRIGAAHEQLDRRDLERRYPQFDFGPVSWGIIEQEGGVLMARRSVQLVVEKAIQRGVTYLQQRVIVDENSPTQFIVDAGFSAGKYVFACGPWLPKIFPALLSNLFRITRQEVFFFGTPPGDDTFEPSRLPTWIDFNDSAYGMPNLENRGVKIAIDAHGVEFDPDSGIRVVTAEGLATVRSFLNRRLPQLANAPVLETRVCQYENTVNGDFVIDRHPESENVLLVGGGSGHGFKHGPVVGDYVAGLLEGTVKEEPRFSLASKQTAHQRQVF